MVQHVTKDELRAFGREVPSTELEAIRRSASSQPFSGATFLSHPSKDEDLVAGAIKVLKNHGAAVYVDEIDPDMPPYTTEKTAMLLKQRISATSRFVLLASENNKESKWVPWELGVADGAKGLSRIALFPASDSAFDTTWAS